MFNTKLVLSPINCTKVLYEVGKEYALIGTIFYYNLIEKNFIEVSHEKHPAHIFFYAFFDFKFGCFCVYYQPNNI